MNIFALDPSPEIAATYHCDQHIHKMILESAQLLSGMCFRILPPRIYTEISPHIYKPAYLHHPCSLWLTSGHAHLFAKHLYLYKLAHMLDTIRQEVHGCDEHSSIPIINTCHAFLSDHSQPYAANPAELWNSPDFFPRAMPAFLKYNLSLSSIEAYRRYYIHKNNQWIDKGGPSNGMTWKNRPTPSFMIQESHV